MFRVLLVLLFLSVVLEVSAQGVVVPKSKEVIVLRGKSYYLHTVIPGQTLFSICKAYGVEIEEIKGLNNKKDNALSQYEVLKIPYIDSISTKDNQFHYHKIVKGETIYSVARLYKVDPKQLMELNPTYEASRKPLRVGEILKVSLLGNTPMAEKQITQVIKQEEIVDKPIVIKPKQEVESKMEIAINKEAYLPSQIHSLVNEKRMPDHISEVIMPADPFVKIALFLPLSANEYPHYIDTLQGQRGIKISARSEQFLSFYAGVLLAVDSLKKNGSLIDLHVFDTERSSEKMNELAGQINELHPDLIIGPIYGSVYKILAERLQDKDIPLIYPLSSRSENFGVNANYVQVNVSVGVLAEKMKGWLQKQRAHANLIALSLTGSVTDLSETLPIRNAIKEIPGMNVFKWNVSLPPLLDSLRSLLLPDRENILVLPFIKETEVGKVLPYLSALADGYRITVLGLPEWQTFSSVDHETYYKLNTKIFTYSYVDYSSHEAQVIAGKYRQYFHSEPNGLVFKAFDMGMYFIRLAEKYRDRSLEALEYYQQPTGFSKFSFERIPHERGLENHGFFIVNYGSDYRLKIIDI